MVGGASSDTVVFSTAVTSGSYNLGSGLDTITLGNFANSLTVSNVETITGGTLSSDVVTRGSAVTSGTRPRQWRLPLLLATLLTR